MLQLFTIRKRPLLPTLISYVFHPLLMPSIGVFFIFQSGARISSIDPGAQWYIIGMVLAFTYLLPALILVAMYFLRFIGHLEASERNERVFPVAVTSVIYYLAYSFLKQHDILVFVALFVLATDIVLILLLIINFFWKVSLHSAGIGGICALTLFLSVRVSPANALFFAGAVALAGLIAHARLSLQEHTPWQVAVGFATGFAPVYGMFIFI